MRSLRTHFFIGKGHTLLGLVLLVLLVLELLTGGYQALQQNTELLPAAATLKISELDSPTIDGAAAVTSYAEEICFTESPLASEVWFLVLIGMGILLLVNFHAALGKKHELEWLPELAYVIFILLAWSMLDRCQIAAWFPLVLVKVSLLIFAIYLYLLEKKKTISQGLGI